MMEKFKAARFRLIKSHPYFTTALFAMRVMETESVSTMAVDRYWRLYVNPETEQMWSVPEISGVLYHELLHLLRKHASRMDGRYSTEIANIATDMEINDDLHREQGITLPRESWMPETFDLPPYKLAEWYADELRKREEGKGGKALQMPFKGSCGSGATGISESWELSDGESGHSDEDERGIPQAVAEAIRRKVAEEILSYGKHRGLLPDHLQRLARDAVNPQVDWRAALRTVVRNRIAIAQGADDYSYYRPSPRFRLTGILLPTLISSPIRTGVIVDTSGSISEDILNQFHSEIASILQASGSELVIAAGDADIHYSGLITNVHQIEYRGGGGTSMKTIFDRMVKQYSDLDLVVILTDGATDWPEEDRIPVIVGLANWSNWAAHRVPDWMKVVEIQSAV